MKYLCVLSLIAAASTSACSNPRKVEARENPEPTKVESAADASVVEVGKPEQYRLVTVESRRIAEEIVTNGAVASDVSRNVPVISLSGGRVVDIRARLGDSVNKGDVLLRLVSQDLTQALADYRKFQTDELLARRQLDRAKLLFSRGAIAEKDAQTAENVEEKAKVDVETAKDRIRILGGNLNTLSPIIELTAPASGVIVEQNVTASAGIKSLDNSPNLFTIADLSRVWVLCDVYENNLASVRMNDSAEIRLNAYPDRVFRGRVSNIANLLDPATRTAKVRLELDNPGGIMRPGMFAVATFRSQTARLITLAPPSALLRLHDRDWVFRPIDGGKRFRRFEVRGGPQTSDGMQEILSGLQPGEKIVAQALQLSADEANK